MSDEPTISAELHRKIVEHSLRVHKHVENSLARQLAEEKEERERIAQDWLDAETEFAILKEKYKRHALFFYLSFWFLFPFYIIGRLLVKVDTFVSSTIKNHIRQKPRDYTCPTNQQISEANRKLNKK